MQNIILTQGMFAQVDDEDFGWLNQFAWQYHSNGYATRTEAGIRVWMHHAIAERHGLVFEPELDHRDRNGINNQKANFRSATRSQQQANRGLRNDNSSSYKGVSRYKKTARWRARITHEGKVYYLGNYDTAIAAARAYDQEARRLYGEHANVNLSE